MNAHFAPMEVIIIPAVVPTDKQGTNNRQLRVAAYCRVSTDQEEQQSSYEAQKNHYTEKIATNPEWTLAGIFADEGITGTMAKKRPQFLDMIQKCTKGKIDLIVTKSISRFARNTVDCLHYVRMLKALGIAVIFEKENINTNNIPNEMLLTILSWFAQAESESISQNVTWGKQQSMKKGNVTFNYSNFLGYEKGEDGKPKIVPAEAETIRRIFKNYLAGHSIVRIKQDLENDGIFTKKGKPEWSPNAIRFILNNECVIITLTQSKPATMRVSQS